MSLVRTLVCTEPCVAIYPISTVLDSQAGNVRVILSDCLNEFLAEFMPTRQYLLVPLLVGSKPLLVVIARKVAQKINYFFHLLIISSAVCFVT